MRRSSILLAAVMAAGLSHARSGKLSRDLESLPSGSTVDVIVQYREATTDGSNRKMAHRGGRLRTDLPSIRARHYRVPSSSLDAIANDPAVAYVTPDRSVSASLDYATLASAVDVAQRFPYSLDGTGIAVAVIDSGVGLVDDLENRVVYSQSFLGGAADDAYGHGTHVAGILAGSARRSSGIGFGHVLKGVAPKVKIVSLRALDANGVGTDSAVIAAIQRAIALKTTYNIRVMNLSLGRPVRESFRTDPLCQAVEAAWRAGIVVVVAAGNRGRDNSMGNDGYATIDSPGNDPYVITVGAMKTLATTGRGDDLVASYSSKGPTPIDHVVKPDLVAAGNRIVSLYQEGQTIVSTSPSNVVKEAYYKPTGNSNASRYYLTLSGTSMAAPIVSGAVALLLQRSPLLTPDQVKARLMRTAYKGFPAVSTAVDPDTGAVYTSHYDPFTVGAGYLDVASALSSLDLFAGTALSPTAVVDAATGRVRLVATSVSGTTPIGGDFAVWGDFAIWGDFAVWGDTALWGDSSTAGFFAVWGDTALWSDSSQAAPEALRIAVHGEE